MNTNTISLAKRLITITISSCLFACNAENNSEFSLSTDANSSKAIVNVPWASGTSRSLPIEQLQVAVTFDDSDPIYLARNNGKFIGEFPPLSQDKPIKLGITWFTQNVHLAALTKDIVLDPNNPTVSFFSEDYQLLDSDGDLIPNILEIETNTDPFDGTDWPDIPNINNQSGLIGTTGEKETVRFGQFPHFLIQEETSGSMKFVFGRAGTTTLPITIEYETLFGTADNLDFVETSGTLNWPAGSDELQSVEVELRPDNNIEDEEYFRLKLKDPVNADNRVFEQSNMVVGKIINVGGDGEWPTNNSSLFAGWYDASTDRYGVSINARVEILLDGTYNAYQLLQDCYIKSTHDIMGVRSAGTTKIAETSLFILDSGIYRLLIDNGILRFTRSDNSEQFQWNRIGELGPLPVC